MKIIGLTGGIGAGKSVVSRILRCKGFVVYDCDSRARKIMDGNDRLKMDIASRLGADCIAADGLLCRRRIAEVVFAEKELLLWLNSRVHSLVRDDIAEFARVLENSPHSLLFVESAILKSSHLDKDCDEIWLVDAPEDIRLKRAVCRDSASESEIKARMKAQMGEFSGFGNTPVRRIDNSGSVSLLASIDNYLNDMAI